MYHNRVKQTNVNLMKTLMNNIWGDRYIWPDLNIQQWGAEETVRG